MTTIVLSVLMVYMIIASIICAVQAARDGGAANSVMLFSVLITYGRKSGQVGFCQQHK